MNTILCLAVALVTLCCYGEAGQNFPPEAQYLTKQIFNKINPAMEEDWTDYMQELAGEFTTCEEIFEHQDNQGHWELKGKRAPNQRDRVGALIDYVAWETTDRQGIDAIAKRTFEKWIGTFPFDAQIREATNYGCSVAPGCPPTNRGGVVAPTGYAVVGCGFYPKCKNEGCVADQPPPTRPPPPPQFDVRARALTPEQYAIAEEITGKRWDRSHLLEDMSGTETDCSMIGQSQWQYNKAQAMANPRGLDVYGRFGYTPHTGNTPDPMLKVLREISDAERLASSNQVSGGQFGCSIIPDCFSRVGASRNEMYVVVSCLFSRTDIRQNPSPFRRGDTRPNPRPETRPNPRPETRPFPRPETRPFPRPSQDNVDQFGRETRPFPRPDEQPETRPFPRPETRPFPRPDENNPVQPIPNRPDPYGRETRPFPRPETRPFPRPDEDPVPNPIPNRPDPYGRETRPFPRPNEDPVPNPIPNRPDPYGRETRPFPRPDERPQPNFLPAGGDPRIQPVDRESSLIQPNYLPSEGGREPVKPLPHRPDDPRHLPARPETRPFPRPDERPQPHFLPAGGDPRIDQPNYLPSEGGREPVKPLPHRPDDPRHLPARPDDPRLLPARPDRPQGEFLPATPIRGDQGDQAEDDQKYFFW